MVRPGRGAGRRKRLSRSGEFERAYRQGAAHGNRFLVLYAFARPAEGAEESRLGVSTGRKLGGAVQRNKIKRALREAYRDLGDELPGGYDYVLVARQGIEQLIEREGKEGVTATLREIVRESGLGNRANT